MGKSTPRIIWYLPIKPQHTKVQQKRADTLWYILYYVIGTIAAVIRGWHGLHSDLNVMVIVNAWQFMSSILEVL